MDYEIENVQCHSIRNSDKPPFNSLGCLATAVATTLNVFRAIELQGV